MAYIRTTVSAITLLSLVAACANPVVAPRVTPRDADKDCAAIQEDIQRSSDLKRAARADDEFQWRYIFVVNGFVSAYRMNKAEEAAQARLEALRKIGHDKGCFGSQDKVIEPVTSPQGL